MLRRSFRFQPNWPPWWTPSSWRAPCSPPSPPAAALAALPDWFATFDMFLSNASIYVLVVPV